MSKGNRVREQRRIEEERRIEEALHGGNKKKVVPANSSLAKVPWKKLCIAILAIVVICAAGFGIYRHQNLGKFDDASYVYSNYDKYVDLGEYKGLEYSVADATITDKDVQEEIKNRLSNATKTEDVKSGVVKKGDTVKIDYVGKMDGKEFTGGSAKDQSLQIGSNSFIAGFESGLIGKKVGETVTLHLTFPKNYSNTELAGKKVDFTVTINSKTVTTKPEYNEAFIKENSDYTTKKDYEASIKKELQEAKSKSVKETAASEIVEKAVEKAKMKKYPKGKVNAELEKLKSQYESMATQYGMSYSDYLSAMGTTEKDFEKSLKTAAKEQVKHSMTVYAIAKKEGVTFKKSEFKDYLTGLLKDANMTEDQFKESYGKSVDEYAEDNGMQVYYMANLVGEKLMDLGKEKKGK